jgi:hypothetical protein
MTVLFTKYYKRDQINKHGMGGVHGMLMEEDKCAQNVGGDA